jgi:hypothetical protein
MAGSFEAAQADTIWTQSLGTSSEEIGRAVAVDSAGNSYLGGSTSGNLAADNGGGSDAFIAKYDMAGDLQWVKQYGTPLQDIVLTILPDDAGNLYVGGRTKVDSAYGAYVRKYDDEGNMLWHSDWSRPGEDGTMQLAMAPDGTLASVSYSNGDCAVLKYSIDGVLLQDNVYTSGVTDVNWIPHSLAIDSQGYLSIVGRTRLNESPSDAWAMRVSPQGQEVWRQQWGSSAADVADVANAVVVDDSGNMYIAGRTSGLLGDVYFGQVDAFLAKYNVAGTLVWLRQFGTKQGEDYIWDVGQSDLILDGTGNLLVVGYTEGDFGSTNQGGADVYIAKFDVDGNPIDAWQFGSSVDDYGVDAAIGPDGDLWIGGSTFPGALGEGKDAALWRVAIPEPATLSLLALGGLAMLRRRKACR